jgi:hypothetical protein
MGSSLTGALFGWPVEPAGRCPGRSRASVELLGYHTAFQAASETLVPRPIHWSYGVCRFTTKGGLTSRVTTTPFSAVTVSWPGGPATAAAKESGREEENQDRVP